VEGRLASLGPGVEVLMVETAPTRGSRALRVLLDRPGGVDHDLCARASHELQGLSRELAIEVSSPGPDRPLTKPDHYRRFVGRRVRIRTRERVEGRRDFKGELVGSDDHGVTLAAAWGTVTVAHDRIRRCNLVPEPVRIPGRR